MKKQLLVLTSLLLVWSFNMKAFKTDPSSKKDSSSSLNPCITTMSAPASSCGTTFTVSGYTGTDGNTGHFTLLSGTGTLVSTGSLTASYTPGVNEGAAVIKFWNNGEDGCTGLNSTATKTIVTSAALTPASITGNASVCQNSQNTYTVAAEPSATSYSWTFPSGCSTVSSTSVTTTELFGATSGNVMVMAHNVCGSSGNFTLSVTVNDFPIAPVAIIGPTLLCANATTGISYSVAPVANTTSYTWTLSGGGSSITSGTNTNAITANLGPENFTISVAATNTCGTGNTTSIILHVDTMPQNPNVISGVGSVCPGQLGVSYSVGSVAFATSYIWTLPTGATIVGGNNTNSITVNYSTGASNGNVYVSVANAACNSGASPALLVTIYSLPSVAINSPTLCVGTSSLVTAFASGTSSPYTYTWSTGATGSSISSPSVTTNYTVTVTDFNGCMNSGSATVVVHPLPTVQINGMTSICIGSTDLLTASGANTYTWNTSATGTNIAVSPVVNTNYQVTGTDGNNCVNSATVGVTVNPLPTVTVNSTTVCAGNTATLTASGATTYTWNTSPSTTGATVTASPTVTTSYTVTGTDVNSCTNTAIAVITEPANPAPDICMVSTDSFFVNNIVYWDRTAYANADSFLVYRLSSGVYLRIGATSKDSNQLTDLKRNIGGPNGGDPNISSWYYKIAVKDTCGNISPMSPYHETVNFQQNNQNLTWNAYVIESPQINPVNNYAVWRDSLGIGDWHIFVNTSGLSTNDNTYTSYPNANYRVDATPFTCTSNEARLSGNNNTFAARVKSHSNINNNRATGIKQFTSSNNHVNIYPNPNNGSFVIEPNSNTIQTIQMYDVNGKIVLSQTITGKTNIDASSLNEGVYNISLISNEGVVNKRVVIVR